MAKINRQKQVAVALIKEDADKAAKTELDNLAALAAKANRKAAAKAEKNMKRESYCAAAKAMVKNVSYPCKGASKHKDHHSDSGDEGTVVTQGRQNKPYFEPPEITNISTSTTFASVIKVARPYTEDDQHLNSDTRRLMTDHALFVMQKEKWIIEVIAHVINTQFMEL